MRLAYLRVSSEDQNDARQRDLSDINEWFVEKVSGKDTERPELQRMLSYLRPGDQVVCWSMDRMCRNLRDMLEVVETITAKGASLEFVTERLTFAGDDDPFARLHLSILSAVAEFERKLILRRQAEGIEKAKQRGIYRGRAPALRTDDLAMLRQRVESGVPVARVARDLGVGRNTAFRALKPSYVPREEWAT